jgi:hypothetical protein
MECVVSARWSHLPYPTEDHGIIERIFWRKFDFKGLVAPKSPDLFPPDFFLWGHLKGHVYNSNPHTIEDMETNISGQCKHKSKNSSSSGTEYGETSEFLHSGEWWALPAPFMECIQVLLYCISHILFYYNDITDT